MKYISLFSGVGGFDLPLSELGYKVVDLVEMDPQCQIILDQEFIQTFDTTTPTPPSTPLLEASPVPTSHWPTQKQWDWREVALDSGLNSIGSSSNVNLRGWFLRTFQTYSGFTTEPISPEYYTISQAFPTPHRRTAGKQEATQHPTTTGTTTLRGVCWTANFSESPNDVVESTLSDVLQTPDEIHSRYYLSEKACKGVIRRISKSGKRIPSCLAKVLISQAGLASPPPSPPAEPEPPVPAHRLVTLTSSSYLTPEAESSASTAELSKQKALEVTA